MNRKLIGSVLMIVGTSLGGGMLALPVANAETGFFPSTALLFAMWVLMTFCAFLILEVNLWFPKKSNLISMAEATLGKPGKYFAWVTYLFLLYALLSAYIAGGADILGSLFTLANFKHESDYLQVIIFTLTMGWVIYKGVRAVDNVNGLLMTVKLSIYALLIILISPHIQVSYLLGGKAAYAQGTFMVLIVSFGYAIIVPTLRVYLDDDVVLLREAILIGSFIPLICYTLWDLVIMGVLPIYGGSSLANMMHSGHATTELTKALIVHLQQPWVTALFRGFSALSMLTAFLGVGISLTDFLADGMHIDKDGKQGWIVYSAVFIPPLLIVLAYPNAFIEALKYGGLFCVFLLVLLPALMAYSGRYHAKIARGYEVIGGKAAISLAIIVGMGLIGLGALQLWNS